MYNEVILIRVRKYAKFGVFYAKIVQMTPQRLRRESLRLQNFLVTNSFVLAFFATNTIKSSKLKNFTAQQNRKRVNYDQSLLDNRHDGFELSRSADHHSYFVYPHNSVYMPGPRAGKSENGFFHCDT